VFCIVRVDVRQFLFCLGLWGETMSVGLALDGVVMGAFRL